MQYAYSALLEEYAAMINVRRKNNFHIDSAEDLYGKDCVFLCLCVWDILCMQEMEVTDYVQ